MTSVTFDTSALNRLHDLVPAETLRSHLDRRGWQALISAVSVVEIGATQETARRTELLRYTEIQRRQGDARLLDFPAHLARRATQAWARGESEFVSSIEPANHGLQQALQDPEALGTAELEESRSWQQGEEGLFRSMHTNARSQMQALPEKQRPRGPLHWIAHHAQDPALLVDFFQGDPVFEAIRSDPRRALREVPTLCTWLQGVFLGIWRHGLSRERFGFRRNAGWTDLQQSTYLAVVDVFVTHDRAQHRVFRGLARGLHRDRRIVSVSEFLQVLGCCPTPDSGDTNAPE